MGTRLVYPVLAVMALLGGCTDPNNPSGGSPLTGALAALTGGGGGLASQSLSNLGPLGAALQNVDGMNNAVQMVKIQSQSFITALNSLRANLFNVRTDQQGLAIYNAINQAISQLNPGSALDVPTLERTYPSEDVVATQIAMAENMVNFRLNNLQNMTVAQLSAYAQALQAATMTVSNATTTQLSQQSYGGANGGYGGGYGNMPTTVRGAATSLGAAAAYRLISRI